jgi:hypothetical protein
VFSFVWPRSYFTFSSSALVGDAGSCLSKRDRAIKDVFVFTFYCFKARMYSSSAILFDRTVPDFAL